MALRVDGTKHSILTVTAKFPVTGSFIVRPHSRPQRRRSFCSAPKIETSGRSQFLEHVQSTRFVFSANQICRVDNESVNRGLPVLEPARGLFPRSLVLTGRIAASAGGGGDENG